ncbi:Amidase family protein [Methylococcus capsulatus]|jgi:amidase|uniref:Amidase family protein n=2 Tax=Methylococcus capsulatus TaxID=414 RepID=A0AA35UA72_METCP|nr:Amidase family protein [Methylococcus capsulatus]
MDSSCRFPNHRSSQTFRMPESSRSFLAQMEIRAAVTGPLVGLSFGVKDLIDIAGHVTGCANPDWARSHPPAVAHAVCVEQCLQAGAVCLGKTCADELAFGLTGENAFYGTPLNPAAPDRVPGGSSSGSAVAVAAGEVDFALGTDTAGSIRLPASNCGIWGMRPSHGGVSVAGVNPLAPGFDTVGAFARNGETLQRVMSLLLNVDPLPTVSGRLWLLQEGFDAAEPAVRKAFGPVLKRLAGSFPSREISLRSIDGEAGVSGMDNWRQVFQPIQWAEIWSTLGTWIESARPALGERTRRNFELAKGLDRRLLPAALARRERYRAALARVLGPEDVICFPTVHAPAPLKGSLGLDRTQGDYFPRVLARMAIAGICRLPQISLPAVEVEGAPVGLSLLAAEGNDAFLMAVAQGVAAVLDD